MLPRATSSARTGRCSVKIRRRHPLEVRSVERHRPKLAARLNRLFGAGAQAAEFHGQGDPALLLSAEAAFLGDSVAKRRQEFAAGRACARLALAELGIHDVAVGVAEDRQPIWPPCIVGSITHTADYCAAVAAPIDSIAAIGLDSEEVTGVKPELWPRICLPVEIAWLNTLAEPLRLRAATTLFSAKEAFYKCQYPLVRERLLFHDVRIELNAWDGPGGGTFKMTPTRPLRFAAHTPLPMTGRYLFHEEYVTTGLFVAAGPVGAGSNDASG